MSWSISHTKSIKELPKKEGKIISCDHCFVDLTKVDYYALLSKHYEGYRYCLSCAKFFLEDEIKNRNNILSKIKELILV